MLEAIEFIASIFKRRLKLTKWETHQVMCGRAEGNKLVVEYGNKEVKPEVKPYVLHIEALNVNERDVNLKCQLMTISNITYHELEIGAAKYSYNSAGDDMYCLTTVDAEKVIKHLYFKKDLLISVY